MRRSPLFVALAKSSLVVRRAFFGSTLLLRVLLAFTLKDVSDPWHGVQQEQHDLHVLPCERGNRASWRDDGCLVGRCALSWVKLLVRLKIHKCGGSKEATVEVWIGAGQTRPQPQVKGWTRPGVVDNYLRFSLKSSTFRLLHRLSAEIGIL